MSTYTDHLDVIQKRWDDALHANGFDAALLSAGMRRNYFLDDQAPVFRANPHLAQWFDAAGSEHAFLLVRPGTRARLFFFQPRDYWHQPPSVPDLGDALAVEVFATPDALLEAACRAVARDNRVALVGDPTTMSSNLPSADINPAQLLNQIHYGRAVKTPYEIECMRQATRIAVAGHRAARDAYSQGRSEFAIHQAYLSASQQTEAELPYSSIVAQNEHAGVLHYQHYDRAAPARRASFLIDAGGRQQGYASDITRTYAADPRSEFAALIEALDARQLTLIDSIRPGVNFVELHETMQRAVAELLVACGALSCSAEQAFDEQLTDTFLPHGLGHLIGLQTHDVAGHMVSPDGGSRPPPARYPALRLTRDVTVDQVFTIEPGIYFIPLLLDELRSTPKAKHVNWAVVERFLPYGGIRIEDNVWVRADGNVNLTRVAFADAAAP